MSADAEDVQKVGDVCADPKTPLTDRFRALFTLQNLGGAEAVRQICRCFADSSALLKHECAFCLGQMKSESAIPTLLRVLADESENSMVRHEAGEALGAIGKNTAEVVSSLERHAKSDIPEIAETCQLALQRILWLATSKGKGDEEPSSIYATVDPAPAKQACDVEKLRNELVDEKNGLFERYRAMFTLRNIGTPEAALALTQGLKASSALFRHEVAYVLGQLQSSLTVEALRERLQDASEHPMVRHECAEALGSIANETCVDILKQFSQDSERVVRESCAIALDMWEYENSGQFQYADVLVKVQDR